MPNQKSGAYVLLGLTGVKIIVNAAFAAAVIGLLVLFGLQFPHAAKLDSLGMIRLLHGWGDPALAAVAAKFQWAWPAEDVSFLPVGIGFVLLAAKMGIDIPISGLSRIVKKRLPLPEESVELSATASSQGISVSDTLLALAAVSEKARAKLQRRFTRVEGRLEHAKQRQCAFLSVGVVDPEGMKKGATPETITESFAAYEAMLDEIFKLTGAWKLAWTTDGVMVCYLEVSQALDAAQRVLKGLSSFNATRNELPTAFRVCCGINEGEVAIYEDSKLQKVADRVIDVAGHMQKHARPNTLWLSSEVHGHLQTGTGFQPAHEEVDGYTVLEWAA